MAKRVFIVGRCQKPLTELFRLGETSRRLSLAANFSAVSLPWCGQALWQKFFFPLH